MRSPGRSRYQGSVVRPGELAPIGAFFPLRFMNKALKKNKDVTATRAEGTAAMDAATASQDAKRRPIKTIRVGDCSASIWAREYARNDTMQVFYSVTLERSYRDAGGQYRYTKTFDPPSLPQVVSLCQQAQEAIDELQQAQ